MNAHRGRRAEGGGSPGGTPREEMGGGRNWAAVALRVASVGARRAYKYFHRSGRLSATDDEGIEGSPAGARFTPSARRFRRHTHLRPRWRLLPGSTTASGTSSSSPTTRTRTPGRSSSRRTRSAGSRRVARAPGGAREARRVSGEALGGDAKRMRRSSPARRSPAPRGARDAQGVRRGGQGEIAKEARERKFNADEMLRRRRSLVGSACQPDAGRSVWTTSRTRRSTARSSTPPPMTFEEDYSDMAEFFKSRTHLLTEHAMGYLLLKCLYRDGRRHRGHAPAARRVRAQIHGDFADAGKKEMKDAARPFFCRLADEPRVLKKEYRSAYEDYCEKLTTRGGEEGGGGKEAERKAAEAESASRGRWRRCRGGPARAGRVGPGGGVRGPLQTDAGRVESGDVDALRAYVSNWRRRRSTCAPWSTADYGSRRRGKRAPRCKTDGCESRRSETDGRVDGARL